MNRLELERRVAILEKKLLKKNEDSQVITYKDPSMDTVGFKRSTIDTAKKDLVKFTKMGLDTKSLANALKKAGVDVDKLLKDVDATKSKTSSDSSKGLGLKDIVKIFNDELKAKKIRVDKTVGITFRGTFNKVVSALYFRIKESGNRVEIVLDSADSDTLSKIKNNNLKTPKPLVITIKDNKIVLTEGEDRLKSVSNTESGAKELASAIIKMMQDSADSMAKTIARVSK